jgi:hypothetical protein
MVNIVVVRFNLTDIDNSQKRFKEARSLLIGEHTKTFEEMGK